MSASPATKLVILDRDDTLVRVPAGRHYLYGDDEIRLIDGVVPFLRRLAAARITAVVATNQQGVALPEHPEMTLAAVDRFHRRLVEELDRCGAPVARVYVCPHAAAVQCNCRKPRPGLFLEAMKDNCAAPEQTAAIGDRWRDVLAARAADVGTIFFKPTAESLDSPVRELVGVRQISSFEECLAMICR